MVIVDWGTAPPVSVATAMQLSKLSGALGLGVSTLVASFVSPLDWLLHDTSNRQKTKRMSSKAKNKRRSGRLVRGHFFTVAHALPFLSRLEQASC